MNNPGKFQDRHPPCLGGPVLKRAPPPMVQCAKTAECVNADSRDSLRRVTTEYMDLQLGLLVGSLHTRP